MNIGNLGGYTLNNLNKINIILGKNGSGKSTILRHLQSNFHSIENFGKSKYITPERGGALVYDAGVEQNLSNESWTNERMKNLAPAFRQQSVAQYRKLKDIILEEIENEKRSDKDYKFDLYIDKINSLLDNIKIQRNGASFKIYKRDNTQELSANVISSGESELISLGIECLIFSKEIIAGKENILFLDEPDVHLHPDLQVRLVNFLINLVDDDNFRVVIATHSTAILGVLERYSDTGVAFLSFGQKEIEFSQVTDVYKKILPIFGAHPLSNFFNESPILLVEGEDDERIWQQVVRSSQGKIKLYPCSVESVDNLNDYEIEAQKILNSVYDNAKGFSLRDKDDGSDSSITDLLPIVRMKLSCRNAENLLLADETLNSLSVNWLDLKSKIETWLLNNASHPHFQIMNNFKEGGFDRKNFDIKDIRNDLMGIIGSSKPWEVAVGQAIANINMVSIPINFNEDGKILSFLGEKVVCNLLIAT